MANGAYAIGWKERVGRKLIDIVSDVINATLVDTASYAVNLATHADLADVPVGMRIATTALGTKTFTLGVFKTADFVWASVTGAQSEGILLHDSTVSGGSLLTWYDTGVIGMPVTPNGGPINVTVPVAGWFAL